MMNRDEVLGALEICGDFAEIHIKTQLTLCCVMRSTMRNSDVEPSQARLARRGQRPEVPEVLIGQPASVERQELAHCSEK